MFGGGHLKRASGMPHYFLPWENRMQVGAQFSISGEKILIICEPTKNNTKWFSWLYTGQTSIWWRRLDDKYGLSYWYCHHHLMKISSSLKCWWSVSSPQLRGDALIRWLRDPLLSPLGWTRLWRRREGTAIQNLKKYLSDQTALLSPLGWTGLLRRRWGMMKTLPSEFWKIKLSSQNFKSNYHILPDRLLLPLSWTNLS